MAADQLLLPGTERVQRSAVFSRDHCYRYSLTRRWDTGPLVAFVGLNPSIADAEVDDPTIRRCMRFARDWGYAGLRMVNLFGLVSPYPKALRDHPDPVGPGNDEALRWVRDNAALVIAAWGQAPEGQQRAIDVVEQGLIGRDYQVLGLTRAGIPRHPLYMRASCRPQRPEHFRRAAA